MQGFFDQPIKRFVKIHHVVYCAIAYVEKDVENFIRHFFFAVMDRKNTITFQTAIATVIHELTGWEIRNINKTIQRMVKQKELVRRGYKQIQYNPNFANRVIVLSFSRLGYDGEDVSLSQEQLHIITEINRLIQNMPQDRIQTEEDIRDEEMSALLKQMDEIKDQNKKMQQKLQQLDDMESKLDRLTVLVETIARGGSVTAEEARRHLTLVKK
jgi:hypothetical protein